MSKMVTILGPTASGKTALAINLAKKFNGEIICADSRTIYKNMDIGTAKPTVAEQNVLPHNLLDVINPDEEFSVARFKKLATLAIADIQKRGKLPFLVGGSGLYIDSILFDYQFERSNKIKQTNINKLSMNELQSRVAQEYPELVLNNSEHNNRRRLERILVTGPVKVNDRDIIKLDSLVLGIDVKIPILKQNIAKRTKYMLNNGFVREVKNIEAKYGDNCAQLQTTGYREVLNYLKINDSEEELETAINNATYKLARKQMTWFRRNSNIVWVTDYQTAEQKIIEYLKV